MLTPIERKAFWLDMTSEAYEQWSRELEEQPPMTRAEKRMTMRFVLLIVAAVCNICTMVLTDGILPYLGCAFYELLIAFLLWFMTDVGLQKKLPLLRRMMGFSSEQ